MSRNHAIKGAGKFVTAVLLLGLCSVAHAQIVVQFDIDSANNKLIATTPGNCQNPPNKPGCVRASGRVQINLTLPGITTCANGGNWELDYVALGTSEGQMGNISAVAADDFGADQTTGVVTAVTESDRHILIRNNNTQAYDVWYTVYASCSGDGTVADSDPRFENNGSG